MFPVYFFIFSLLHCSLRPCTAFSFTNENSEKSCVEIYMSVIFYNRFVYSSQMNAILCRNVQTINGKELIILRSSDRSPKSPANPENANSISGKLPCAYVSSLQGVGYTLYLMIFDR